MTCGHTVIGVITKKAKDAHLKGLLLLTKKAKDAYLREALLKKKMFSFGHCPNYLPPPPSPQFGQLVPLFFKRQKRRFKRHSKAETKNNAKSDKKVNYYQKFRLK